MEKLILMRPTAEYAKQIMECKKEYLAANSSTVHEPNENKDMKRFWIILE